MLILKSLVMEGGVIADCTFNLQKVNNHLKYYINTLTIFREFILSGQIISRYSSLLCFWKIMIGKSRELVGKEILSSIL